MNTVEKNDSFPVDPDFHRLRHATTRLFYIAETLDMLSRAVDIMTPAGSECAVIGPSLRLLSEDADDIAELFHRSQIKPVEL